MSRRPSPALFAAALGLLAAPLARAQDVLRLPIYAAADAGAGLTVATARGAAALFATPAGMAGGGDARRGDGGVTVLLWNEGRPITVGAAAAAVPLGRGLPLRPTVGVFASGFVRETGAEAGAATDARSEALLGVALGVEVGANGRALRAGVALKGVRVAFVDDAVFLGPAVDVGVQGEIAGGDLVAGLAVRHLGPSLRGPGRLRSDLPAEVRVGASWQALNLRADDGATLARLRVVADVSDATDEAVGTILHAGAEVAAFGQFAVRVGRAMPFGDASQEPSRWTFGLGYAQGRLRADAAVLPSPQGSDASASFTLRALL